jgi:hypothetical protein
MLTLQELEVDDQEHQDNCDVCYQSRYEKVPQEEDVDTDHDHHQSEHVQRVESSRFQR